MQKTLPGYNKVYIGDANKVRKGFQSGLFAAKDLAVGEIIFHARGEKVVLEVLNKKDSASYANALGLQRGLWINPPNTNPLRFLNHSCEPNAGIKGKVTIVARRPIKKDEHITIDYSITECDEFWDLGHTCACGAKNCRKKITAIQTLPLSTYKKYLPFINLHMQKEYRKAHNL